MSNAYQSLCTLLNAQEYKASSAELPWNEIIRFANGEYLIPALCGELHDKNLFDLLEDEILKQYLQEMYALNTIRNKQLYTQLKEISELFEAQGIQALFLKGAAVLSEKDYRDIPRRFMLDLDIMVRPEQLNDAISALFSIGYKDAPSSEIPALHHHLPGLYKQDMPAQVEIHRRIIGTAIEYIPFNMETCRHSLNPDFSYHYILQPTYRLYHAFLHTEIAELGYFNKTISLRHLYDFTVLATFYKNEIDWNLLETLIRRWKQNREFEAYLYMAKSLLAFSTPLTKESRKGTKEFERRFRNMTEQITLWKRARDIFPAFFGLYHYSRMVRLYGVNSFSSYVYVSIMHIRYQMQKYLFSPERLIKMIKALWNK